VGVDSSPDMLAAAPRDIAGLEFVQADIATWTGDGLDLVLANASLQWVPDHARLLARLRGALRAGGQLAFQVPANGGHASHRVALAVAQEPPFAAELEAIVLPGPNTVLAPERYAELLYDLGASQQVVRLSVYGHVLESSSAVVEWVKGTFLVPFRAQLDAEAFEGFVARYRALLLEDLGDVAPYFYAFPRILCWARFD
jgi:trans-aconitate 2-methyltransferase